MKSFHSFTWIFLLFGSVVFSTSSAFDSLYVFGDGICTTTDNPTPGPSYYGNRYSNGRVWVEVLAQRQGLTYDANKNNSFFGNYSSGAVTDVNQFTAPADATNDLFVVWVCDADFVYDMNNLSLDLTTWNNAINQSLANHFNIITNLYAKGVRTLILPNAVDMGEIPEYDQMAASDKSFVRGRIVYFNTNLVATVNQAKTLCPGLKIYIPDIFSLLDKVLTNAASYGLTNALYNGQPTDAIEDPNIVCNTNGLGTNYIFWRWDTPTAQMNEVIADTVQQLISPMRISQVTPLAGNTRVDIVNVPVGLNGFVFGGTNLTQTNWVSLQTVSSTNVNQTVLVPTNGPQRFYRLRFPDSWSWP